MKELIFLPDRDGRDEIGDASGFVRVGASADALQQLSARLTAPAAPIDTAVEGFAWRSALALALLADAWPECGVQLRDMTLREDASAFAACVLAARPEREKGMPMHLLLLERGEEKALLGIADRAEGVLLPAQRAPLDKVLPARAAWIDRDTGRADDPVPYLNEAERTLLLRRMEALRLTGPSAQAFMEALRNADAAEEEAVRRSDVDALQRLALRTEAVCGLKDFAAFSQREEPCAPGGNELLRCLGVAEPDVRLKPCCSYLWRGVPFARTSEELGLTGGNHPEEAATLKEIMQELTLMSGCSVKWNYAASVALRDWLDARRTDMLAPAHARLEESCALLRQNGSQVQSAVTLTWPWSEESGAVRALLTEALGESWMEAALNPFSDRLTRLIGRLMGDTALHTCCACEDGVYLPPLSREMVACVAREGHAGGLALDAMRFHPLEDGRIEASFLLRGVGEVRFVRAYGPEEIVALAETEAPSVAVWPCLPLAGWRAYYAFVRGGVEVAAMTAEGWRSIMPEERPADVVEDDEEAVRPPETWRPLALDAYPGCLVVLRDGLCLGALPNMLPACEVVQQGDVVIGVDLGSSQTAAAFAWDGVPSLMPRLDATRLLTYAPGMSDDGFLASLSLDSVVPTAVLLNGPGEALFTDGYAFCPATMQDAAEADAAMLRARLKWRSDAESVRARRLLMHHVMLTAALKAVYAGARSAAWRFSIADDMGDEGREALLDAARELAGIVSEESGLPLTQGVPAVTWAEESAALSACLRGEGAVQGSFAVADLGAGSTKMHLWMMNSMKPVAGEVVFEGLQDVLLRFYRRSPVRLLEDLADCGDECLLADVLTFVDQLNPDLAGPRQNDKLTLMLDMLLARHSTAIGAHIVARNGVNQPTWLQAIALETVGAALWCVGMLLAQAGENSLTAHLLPQDLSVCLTGRGAWVLDTLPPVGRNALQNLTHLPLRMDHPVRFITIRTAAKPEESVAMGLCVTRETGSLADAPLIRTRESFSVLMTRLMQQLCMSFPLQMWRLHEGLWDWQSGVLTQAGQESIRRAAASVYDPEEDFAATVMAFLRNLRNNPILPDGMAEPGA